MLFFYSRTSNETDETDCELWPCDAPYTHCDGKWNRPNGCDELNCPLFPRSTCRENEQPCAQFNSSTVGCISLAKAGDGHFDCLFGSDEAATLLGRKFQVRLNADTGDSEPLVSYDVRCWNNFNRSVSAINICDGRRDCPLSDDELFCPWLPLSTCNARTDFACKNGTCLSKAKQQCNQIIDCWPDGEDERLCHVLKPRIIPASGVLKEQYLPLNFDRFVLTERHRMKTECHRGVAIYNEESQMDACLCPPSYHGTHCEQQSERLSIFYRVDVPPEFDRRSMYWLVFYLLDQDGRVLTYEKHLYASFNRQFSRKQLIYLPYPRSTEVHSTFSPKFVQIDAYRVTNVSLHSTDLSWFYSVPFSLYLPVTRLAALLYLESASKNQRLRCQNLTGCAHGSCQISLNTGDPFCRCDDGWFGTACNQRRPTDPCAALHCSDRFSKCVVNKDHAFCLCSVGHLGPKCQIPFDSCSSVHCRNNGTCVSLDERIISHVCVCPSSRFGDQCQYKTAQLTLNIPSSNISYIPVLLIHFLQLPLLSPGILVHQDIFFFRNIHSRTQLVLDIIDESLIPPVVLAQFFFSSVSTYGQYYLLSLSNRNRSQLTVDLQESHRCPDVNERFNSTLISATQLKRLKLYHLYTKDLRCFHDEFYMCLVDRNGFPDCLIYNHNVSMCIERNYCENGGRCLQRKKRGQLEYLCACPQCTAGVFCQIQMNEYSLTLDSIYGPIVLTDVSLQDQPVVIKVSIVLICLMFVVGLISNICSFLVFRHKDIQQVGCGRYFLVLSIFNQVTITFFLCRVIYLLTNQISVIGNVRLLRVSCYLLDFVLQTCISFCDWLHTCIACERTYSALKGAHFDNSQSVRKSKFVIPVLGLLVIGTSIHQVFNHVLIADPRSDARLWCVIKYPREWLRIYEICLNIINNFLPLCINLIAGVILLVFLAKNRHRVSREERYGILFISQMHKHKDLLIAPMTILVAKIPFLLIGISIKCIREGWHTYLSLSAYYLSLVPLISTFLIFVCPSSSYMRKFKEQLGCLH